MSYANLGDQDRAVVFGQRALAAAQKLGDAELELEARYHLGIAFQRRGECREAINVLRPNLELQAERPTTGLPGFATVPAVTAHSLLARALADHGAFAESLAHGREGVRLADEIDHPFSQMNTYLGLGYALVAKGEFELAVRTLERDVELCRTWDAPSMLPPAAALLALARIAGGHRSGADDDLRMAVDGRFSIARTFMPTLVLVTVSEAYLLIDRHDDALSFARRAVEVARERGERGTTARAIRLLGEIGTKGESPDAEQAEGHYRLALSLAHELAMRPLEAHCHLGLGKLYRRTAQLDGARTELGRAVEMLHDLEMTYWLPEARLMAASVPSAAERVG
jgi:tetratricopeptide (TPR) repeat protein